MSSPEKRPDAPSIRAALGDQWASERPLYLGLARALQAAIIRGEIPRGTRLPAERVLSDLLGVSRSTVVATYGVLRDERWVRSRRGSGTYAWLGNRSLDARLDMSQLVDGAAREQARGRRSSADPINLAMSRPAPLDELLREAIIRSGEQIAGVAHDLEYATQGLPLLRSMLAEDFTSRGLPTSERQILITTGAQQAIALVAQLFLRAGDSVLLESPTYLGAIDVFRARRSNLISLPASDAPVEFEAALGVASRTDPALLFLMPTCHTITGAVMSTEAREAFARFSAERDMPLIEDDIFTRLTFEDPEPAPLAAFAPDAPIFTVGSTSKLLWNGLRLGWLRGPERLVTRLTRMKGTIDLGTSLITQLIATHLLQRAQEVAARRLAEIEQRLALANELLQASLPGWRWRSPRGGRSVWAQLPHGDARTFATEALRYGVIIVPGPALSPAGDNEDRIRLMFVQPPEILAEGIHRLSLTWASFAPTHKPAR